MKTLTVECPLPPSGCTQNTYRHWRKKGAAAKQYREECAISALLALSRTAWNRPGKAVLRMTFYCAPRKGDGRYRPLDGGNAIGATKALVDGLVDAGALMGDSHRVLTIMPPVLLRRKDEHKGLAKVVVTVESAEPVGDQA